MCSPCNKKVTYNEVFAQCAKCDLYQLPLTDSAKQRCLEMTIKILLQRSFDYRRPKEISRYCDNKADTPSVWNGAQD